MTSEVWLRPKGDVGIMVEAESITPESLSGKTTEQIEALSVMQGPMKLNLSEFFDVEVRGGGGGGGANPEQTTIVIDGDVTRVKRIGQGMKEGSIEILGSTGMHVGSEMEGGIIHVKGDVGSWAGMEMKGGLIRVDGNAGDHVGCAYRGSWYGMSGGAIQIGGNVKSQLGGGMSGGMITVGGNVENFCGIRQNNGLILVKGWATRGIGAEMIGGTIAVCGGVQQFSPGFVEVGSMRDLQLNESLLEGKFTKFAGDYAISKNPKGVLYILEGGMPD